MSAVREDILKPLYETLVDPAFRHDLGEYYTPDWLATKVVERLLGDQETSTRLPTVLDPACGSGTFLRSVISHLRDSASLPDAELLAAITESVVGIDVHPLAVIISRATYILAIADLIQSSKTAVAVPVYLANSLQRVDMAEIMTLWGSSEVQLEVGHGQWAKVFTVPLDFVRTVSSFDGVIDDVLQVAQSFAESDDSAEYAASALVARSGARLRPWPGLERVLGEMTVHLIGLIRSRQDTIWGFLLRNRYRPTMLRESFDFIVGNPPWLTIGAIEGEEYRSFIREIAIETNIAPRRAGEQGHTELATLFLPQAFRLYLREGLRGPRVAFVMPRSIFNASHHRLLREGGYKDSFSVVELWDLDGVRPLFNVPCCVMFCSSDAPFGVAVKPIVGIQLSGTLPLREASSSSVDSRVTSRGGFFRLRKLGRRTAWAFESSVSDATPTQPVSAYVADFKQGAILYPQTLFCVRTNVSGQIRSHAEARFVSDERAKLSAKKLKNVEVNHVVETSCAFATLSGEHIVPYAIAGVPWLVLLPVLVDDPRLPDFGPVSPSALRAAGRVRAAKWLEWADEQWRTVRKVGDDTPLWTRLDYLHHFSDQANRRQHLVLYSASGSRVFATVVDTSLDDLPLVVRDKTYWASFDRADEAHFLAAMLNSQFALDVVADFMTRGLMGPRDTHKRILDVPFPRFDAQDARHVELAGLARCASLSARELVRSEAIVGASIGRARTLLRASLPGEIIDAIEVRVAELAAERVTRGTMD